MNMYFYSLAHIRTHKTNALFYTRVVHSRQLLSVSLLSVFFNGQGQHSVNSCWLKSQKTPVGWNDMFYQIPIYIHDLNINFVENNFWTIYTHNITFWENCYHKSCLDSKILCFSGKNDGQNISKIDFRKKCCRYDHIYFKNMFFGTFATFCTFSELFWISRSNFMEDRSWTPLNPGFRGVNGS